MEVIDPRILKIESENRELRERLLVLEAKHEEVSRKANGFVVQTTWQFIAFAITMVVTVLGAVYYQTTTLDKRIEQVEKRLEQRIDQLDSKINSVEKSLNARFEDLRQVVLADRKTTQK